MCASMSFQFENPFNGISQSLLIERHQQVAKRNTRDRHKSKTLMLPGESLKPKEQEQTWEPRGTK